MDGKNILVTGGTGSFGKKFVELAIKRHPNISKLVIFSRDELKQYEMSQRFPQRKYPFLRYFLGDVRDLERLKQAFSNIDVVIHAAALKQVPAAEYNPHEFIKTNINGASNIIEAATHCGVERVIALSTDKAVAPINLYGATKLCSDKLFVAANNFAGPNKANFSVVRYGNVMGSRGSVIPFFLKQKETGKLTITHKEMSRFNISLEEGVEMVFYALENALGGEVFVPKIPSYNIETVADAICESCEKEYVGIRPGEKLHEEMITEYDSDSTIEFGKYFAIIPFWGSKEKYQRHYDGRFVKPGFSYNSGFNDDWLSVEEMRELIKNNVEGL